jgi:hypothetical protein
MASDQKILVANDGSEGAADELGSDALDRDPVE